jgi:hypothetical protein
LTLRHVIRLAIAVWILRWAALELASWAGHRLLPRGPAPKDLAERRRE